MANQRLTLAEFERGLNSLEREQLPFALSKTLNEIVKKTQRAEADALPRYIDRPTPFTKTALKSEFSSKRKLKARVYFKDPAGLGYKQHYLVPNVEGIQRESKRSEGALRKKGVLPNGYALVPGSEAPLDAYGNIPGSVYVQVISWFEAFGDSRGRRSNSTEESRNRRRRGNRNRYGFEYFAIQPGQGNLHPGIYQRTFTGFGSAIKLIFAFKPLNQINYAAVYPFDDIAVDVYDNNIQPEFDRALAAAIRSAF